LKQRGFTLIEVLVALMLVSIMALLAWRGLDGMSRAASQTSTYEQSAERLGTALAQWTADLDALTDTGVVAKALDFDGQSLRLTRRAGNPEDGVQVVAWIIRAGQLERYASTALQSKNGLQAAWDNAQRWARTPLPEDAAYVVRLVPASSWQLFYYRGDAWTNPQSSGADAQATKDTLPDGVRLVLDLPADSGFGGKVTRDWVSPALGATR
jgi:general secretion pathway protein J